MSTPEQDFYARLGRCIARARGVAGITQAALAQRVGLSRASITNMEVGRQPVQVHVLVKIAQELKTPLEELVPEPDEQIEAKLERMDQSLRVWVERVISG